MRPDRWQEALALFEEVVALEPEDRAVRLAAVSNSDPELYAGIEALVVADQRADRLLGPFEELFGHPGLGAITPQDGDVTLLEVEDLIGQTVSRYRVLKRLGAGGMGVVYLAEDPDLGRTVALKFLPAHWAHHPTVRERFLREARAAAALDHPNICTIYEVGEAERGRPFIAMAFYEGETVREKIERGPLEVEEALDLTRQTARGLNAAHDAGLIHRDIKPANLIVTDGGVLKILDFGLAKTDQITLTMGDMQVGTPAYMSPEQTRGEEVDESTDLWSLGAVLYEMLTGRQPFRGGLSSTVIHSIRNDEAEHPGRLRDGLPDDVEALVLELLSKDPAARSGGLRRLGEQAPGQRTPRLGVATTAIGMILVVAAVAAGYVATRAPGPVPAADAGRSAADGAAAVTGVAPSRPSIAVLPVENTSGLEEEARFAAGFHDEVLTQLGKIRSLDIKSRRSVLRYRDATVDLATLGEEIGARYIVESAVHRVAGRIRIDVGLFEARTNERIWGNSYDRELTVGNTLDIQRDIAVRVATSLGAEVLPAEEAQLRVQAPENMQAYEHYLDGLFHLRALTLEGRDPVAVHQRAIESLSAAISLAPDWAPPYATLGRIYYYRAAWGLEPRLDFTRSRDAVDAALRLDSLHAPAWAALAFVLHAWERDFEGSEEAYRRAQVLGSPLRFGHALLLQSWGRFPESIDAFRKSVSYDPWSYNLQLRFGEALLCAGEYEEAIDQLKRVLSSLDSDYVRGQLAYAYLKAGRREEGLAELAGLTRRGVSNNRIALGYALAGRTELARALLAEGERRYPPHFARATWTVAAAIELGERERALDYLEWAVNEHHPRHLLNVQCLEEVRSLSGDPRYERVLDRVGFPD
ncbi:MAG: protein kinase [Gemmatimonadota bacterium]